MALLAVLTCLLTLTQGLPSPVKRDGLAPRASCTPTAGGSSSTDDTPAIVSSIASCGDGGTIVIPEDSTYYLNTVLDMTGCVSCTFLIEGLLKFTSSTDYWDAREAMLSVSDITGATFTSETGAGVIDGNGQDSGSDTTYSPKTPATPAQHYSTSAAAPPSQFPISASRTPPNVFYSVNSGSTAIAFSNLSLDATSKSSNEAKNTDGFDLGDSTYITLNDITVSNDDDCVAFKPSASYITVDTITCTGSHGISVGSLGKSSDDTVSNIYVSNAHIINSTKAAGIKTYAGSTTNGVSTVTNVTFTDFTVDNCDYAIQIQSCYDGDDESCAEVPGNAQLEGVSFVNFSGTTSEKYDPVTGNLDCGADGECGVVVSGYTVTAPSGGSEVLCANTPSDLGVTCMSGASG